MGMFLIANYKFNNKYLTGWNGNINRKRHFFCPCYFTNLIYKKSRYWY
jgi:hypothetical protein